MKDLRICEIMSEKNVSGCELAKRLNKSPQYVNGIVKERYGASIKMLRQFSIALDVPLYQLFNK
jgi:transcriptional regulator with XRE-family HTH domain